MAAELPNFKKFVSEDDIEAAKKKRQEEWEKVRKPDQPEEAPEEVYDPRCLFERLQANRVKKEEEFDESHRLKNMVKGLENDEIEFLETVSRQKEQEEQRKDLEERLLLAEYKSSLVHDRASEQEKEIESVSKKAPIKPPPQKPARSQKLLLAGVIRKKSTSESREVEAKKPKYVDSTAETAANGCISSDTHAKGDAGGMMKSKSLLPGIADYSDSDSSDAD